MRVKEGSDQVATGASEASSLAEALPLYSYVLVLEDERRAIIGSFSVPNDQGDDFNQCSISPFAPTRVNRVQQINLHYFHHLPHSDFLGSSNAFCLRGKDKKLEVLGQSAAGSVA